jgi:DNA-binding response OmpR family regulator
MSNSGQYFLGVQDRVADASKDVMKMKIVTETSKVVSGDGKKSYPLPQAPDLPTAQQHKILVVDDNESVRLTLERVLKSANYHVTTASSVNDALKLINTEPFDVLLSDLHMPNAGDGFTVVSAMRHTNPLAVTLVFTGYPALQEAMNAILLQADEILVKPMEIPDLLALIQAKLNNRQVHSPTNPQRVAVILQREALATIQDWLTRVELQDELTRLALTREQRTGHLPKLIEELVQRLRVIPQKLGSNHVSEAAVQHGQVRREQGYSIEMIIEESRILQVSIFDTLQKNLSTVDFSLLLHDVMTIADEVDSQLKQTIKSFMLQAA